MSAISNAVRPLWLWRIRCAGGLSDLEAGSGSRLQEDNRRSSFAQRRVVSTSDARVPRAPCIFRCFVEDRRQHARAFHMLDCADESTWWCLAIMVTRRFRSNYVLSTSSEPFPPSGCPHHSGASNLARSPTRRSCLPQQPVR